VANARTAYYGGSTLPIHELGSRDNLEPTKDEKQNKRKWYGVSPLAFILCLSLLGIAAIIGGVVGGVLGSKKKGSSTPVNLSSLICFKIVEIATILILKIQTSVPSELSVRAIAAGQCNESIILTYQNYNGDLIFLPYFLSTNLWSPGTVLSTSTPAAVNTSLACTCFPDNDYLVYSYPRSIIDVSDDM
jgi:hypothetical protein